MSMFISMLSGKTETRQQEIDFEKLVQKMRAIDTGMSSFKKLLQSIEKTIESLSVLVKEFSQVIPQIYDSSSPFLDISQQLSVSHEGIQKTLENFSSTINKLLSRATEWNHLFNQVTMGLKDREEKKKTYDHYEAKMDKFVQAFDKGKRVDKDQFERNEDKYRKAAIDYSSYSELTAKKINDILGRRYELVNPIISDFVFSELSCVKEFFEQIKKFEEIEEKLSVKTNITNFAFDTKNYDPLKSRKCKLLATKTLYVKSQIGCNSILTEREKEETSVFVNRNIHKNRSSFPEPDPTFISAFFKIKDDLD